MSEIAGPGASRATSSQEAYADLVVAHSPALLRLAVMLTGSVPDAEDLLQSTLLRASRHAERLVAMAAPAGYLRRVMINEHTSRGRRLLRRVRTVSSASPGVELVEPSAPPADEDLGVRDEVWRWLATLSPVQRAVLVLRFYEDLPDAEIAALLDCREATVRSHAFRGLAALRARLTGAPRPEEEP